MQKVIVISAHPDDETLGVGGTLFRHKAIGDETNWLIVTNVCEENGFTKKRVLTRQKEISIVSKLYSFKKVVKLDYPTMKLDGSHLNELINKISKLFEEIKPEVIYVLNRSDAHSDHRIVFEAIMSSSKSFRHSYIKKILMYECISETEFAPILPENVFMPNYFVDITVYFKKKIEAMKIFKSELGTHPFPRSIKNIEALASYRGAIAGVKYAEAFQLLKFIDK